MSSASNALKLKKEDVCMRLLVVGKEEGASVKAGCAEGNKNRLKLKLTGCKLIYEEKTQLKVELTR